MSRLSELIAELCPDGVEYKALGEVCNIRTGLKPKSIAETGLFAYINAGTSNSGYVAESNTIGDTVTTPSRGQGGIGFIGYQPDDFWCGPLCYRVRARNENLLNRFVYHAMWFCRPQILSFVNEGGTPALNRRDLQTLRIPIPPIEVQREVVRILDEYTAAHDELVRQLEEEVSLREQQLSIARNELFMPNDVENVAWVPLGELAEIGTGSHDTKDAIEGGKYVFYARGVDPLSLDEFDFDEVAIITAGDGAGVGKVFHYVDGKYALHQRAYRIHPVVKSILPKYLLHYFKATFYPYIMRSAVSSSVTSIRRRMLDNYMVPVPSLERQRLLVGRLDEMEALSNAMSSELQSQLSLEREQLALVRNQLLSFPEKVA